MTREEAIKMLKVLNMMLRNPDGEPISDVCEAIDMAIEAMSAEAEPTVIRSTTLMPTKDFKEWAKRVRESNPNVIVIPCDAEVVSADAVSREEHEETDGVIKIKKQSANDVGEIKHIVVCSPNYTRYFYNDNMPTQQGRANNV